MVTAGSGSGGDGGNGSNGLRYLRRCNLLNNNGYISAGGGGGGGGSRAEQNDWGDRNDAEGGGGEKEEMDFLPDLVVVEMVEVSLDPSLMVDLVEQERTMLKQKAAVVVRVVQMVEW